MIRLSDPIRWTAVGTSSTITRSLGFWRDKRFLVRYVSGSANPFHVRDGEVAVPRVRGNSLENAQSNTQQSVAIEIVTGQTPPVCLLDRIAERSYCAARTGAFPLIVAAYRDGPASVRGAYALPGLPSEFSTYYLALEQCVIAAQQDPVAAQLLQDADANDPRLLGPLADHWEDVGSVNLAHATRGILRYIRA